MAKRAFVGETLEPDFGLMAAMAIRVGQGKDVAVGALVLGVAPNTASFQRGVIVRQRQIMRAPALPVEAVALAALRRDVLILDQCLRQLQALTFVTIVTKRAAFAVDQVGMGGGERPWDREVAVKAEQARRCHEEGGDDRHAPANGQEARSASLGHEISMRATGGALSVAAAVRLGAV